LDSKYLLIGVSIVLLFGGYFFLFSASATEMIPNVCSSSDGCDPIPVDELPTFEEDLSPTDPALEIIEDSVIEPLLDSDPIWSNSILTVYSFELNEELGSVKIDYMFSSRSFTSICIDTNNRVSDDLCYWGTQGSIYQPSDESTLSVTVWFNHPSLGRHGLILHQGDDGRRTVTMNWVTGTRGCGVPTDCRFDSMQFSEYFYFPTTDAYTDQRLFIGIIEYNQDSTFLSIFSSFWRSTSTNLYKVKN
tara:strand:+ start:46 stop:786 length:741 start_codon:yes stop_codon:yes gene_type:complete